MGADGDEAEVEAEAGAYVPSLFGLFSLPPSLKLSLELAFISFALLFLSSSEPLKEDRRIASLSFLLSLSLSLFPLALEYFSLPSSSLALPLLPLPLFLLLLLLLLLTPLFLVSASCAISHHVLKSSSILFLMLPLTAVISSSSFRRSLSSPCSTRTCSIFAFSSATFAVIALTVRSSGFSSSLTPCIAISIRSCSIASLSAYTSRCPR